MALNRLMLVPEGVETLEKEEIETVKDEGVGTWRTTCSESKCQTEQE